MWLPTGAQYLFYSTSHWQRMVNGFSGAIPSSYRPFHIAMRTFPDEASMDVLRSRGVAYAVIHEEIYGTALYRETIGKVERSPSLMLVHTASDGKFGGEDLSDPQIGESNGAPCRTRTCGLLVRSQTLYPAELRAHAVCSGGRLRDRRNYQL